VCDTVIDTEIEWAYYNVVRTLRYDVVLRIGYVHICM